MTKIDLHAYESAKDFLSDIELICSNALEYNPDRDPEGMSFFFAFFFSQDKKRFLFVFYIKIK